LSFKGTEVMQVLPRIDFVKRLFVQWYLSVQPCGITTVVRAETLSHETHLKVEETLPTSQYSRDMRKRKRKRLIARMSEEFPSAWRLGLSGKSSTMMKSLGNRPYIKSPRRKERTNKSRVRTRPYWFARQYLKVRSLSILQAIHYSVSGACSVHA